MFNNLKSNKFYAKRSTCQFFPSRVQYLVHIVTYEGILIDLRKIKVTIEWVIPRDRTKVQSFLGLASNYRRFVKGFFKIAILFIALLKGTFDSVNWTFDCDSSFLNFCNALTSIYVLTIMDPLKTFFALCNDARDLAIGVVLMEEKHVFPYECRKINFLNFMNFLNVPHLIIMFMRKNYL